MSQSCKSFARGKCVEGMVTSRLSEERKRTDEGTLLSVEENQVFLKIVILTHSTPKIKRSKAKNSIVK